MYNFNAQNKLRKAALRLVASTLTAADVQRLRTTFHQIDTDTTQVAYSCASMHSGKGRMPPHT